MFAKTAVLAKVEQESKYSVRNMILFAVQLLDLLILIGMN